MKALFMNRLKLALLVICSCTLSTIPLMDAYAVTTSNYYTTNAVETYDKSGTTAALANCPPGDNASSETPTGDTNAEILFKFLIGHQLTAKQAAGIVGNVMQESGGKTFNLKTTALNPSSGAYGIAQWTGSRKAALQKLADKAGVDISTMSIQLDYLWSELTGSYYGPRVLVPLKATSDLRSATRVWLERFEIPCRPGAGCEAELSGRMILAQKALDAFGSLAPEALSSTMTSAECTQSPTAGADGTVDASGYAFPIVLEKSLISNGYSWPCRTTAPFCHHDRTAAFDLSKKPNAQNGSAGISVVAVYSGSIKSIGKNYKGTGCQSIQFKGDDGYYYWYGHIRTDGGTPEINEKIKAGTHIAKIGESVCTANGSYAHLHIDRGYPKGHYGGYDSNRDPAFLSIINTLYDNL